MKARGPSRRTVLAGAGAARLALPFAATPARAQQGPPAARDVLFAWYRLVLELVRHTPTYSPPVASRAFAYLGVTAFEAQASRDPSLASLAGRLNALTALPEPPADGLDPAAVLHGALGFAVQAFFGNTGPTGQRAMAAMAERLDARLRTHQTSAAALDYGRAIGVHILDWSTDDGGARVDNLGFPQTYVLGEGPGHWVPTSTIGLQQAPLLPRWGENRPLAMPMGASCPVAPPTAYSEEASSPFFGEAQAVHDAVAGLDAEQEAIARFWSDDPMLSPTPPGHWIAIALEELAAGAADAGASADLLARLGIVMADAFIACWHEKYRHDLVRPVTYIRAVIDPDWTPLLVTPPFPEYPSGHSTQSGAAAAVLEAHFGRDHAFLDTTHAPEGLPARPFSSFWAAAKEAAVSRVYGGIHYPMAASAGLDQGRCVAAYTNALVTRAGA